MRTEGSRTDPGWFERAFFFGSLALLSAVLAYRIAVVWKADVRLLAGLTPDDAYYYLTIARNVSVGLGSTFDGIHATNGFHPLWMLLVAGLAWSIGVGPTAGFEELGLLVRVTLTTQAFVGAVGMGFLVAAARRRTANWLGPGAVLLLASTPFFAYLFVDGMESGVGLAFSSLGYYLLGRRPGRATDLAIGFAWALAALSRLELALFPACLSVALVVLEGRGASRRVVRLGGPTAVCVAGSMAANAILFGSALPISGRIKSTFPWLSFGPGWLTSANTGLLGIAVIVLLATVFAAWRFRRSPDGDRATFAALALFLFGHLCYLVLFTSVGVHKWHFMPYWVAAAVTLPAVLSGACSAAPRKVAGVAAICFACVAAGNTLVQREFVGTRLEKTFTAQAVTAASWARENTEPGEVIAVADAGAFGYFRGNRVLNLDGLVNAPNYRDDLRRLGVEGYFRAKGVRYVATMWSRCGDSGPCSGVLDPTDLVPGGGGQRLVIPPDTPVVFRGDDREGERLVVWDVVGILGDQAPTDRSPW